MPARINADWPKINGAAVRSVRDSLDISRDEVCYRIRQIGASLTPSGLQKIERGETERCETGRFNALARALRVARERIAG